MEAESLARLNPTLIGAVSPRPTESLAQPSHSFRRKPTADLRVCGRARTSWEEGKSERVSERGEGEGVKKGREGERHHMGYSEIKTQPTQKEMRNAADPEGNLSSLAISLSFTLCNLDVSVFLRPCLCKAVVRDCVHAEVWCDREHSLPAQCKSHRSLRARAHIRRLPVR